MENKKYFEHYVWPKDCVQSDYGNKTKFSYMIKKNFFLNTAAKF